MSHYYDKEGNSRHEVIGKSTGRPRPTTIADARTLGLYPSVTTVLDMLRKPQLEKWQQDQVALAHRRMLAAGQVLPAEDKPFCSAVRKAAFQQVRDAADLGTDIHAAIEAHFQGRSCAPELRVYVEATKAKLAEHGIVLTGHELRLVNRTHGYAGTTDAPYKRLHRRGIADFKSRKSDPGYPMDPWEGQATQLAAYLVANYAGDLPPTSAAPWGDAFEAANVFISTNEPGRVEVVFYDEATLRAEWELFRCILRAWQIRNGYVPPGAVCAAA